MPDPLDPNIVYASGNGISKIMYPSEQWINVSPDIDPDAKLRTGFAQPMVWAPWNQHELLAGFQYLMATTDGGAHWTKIGPDLTVSDSAAPADRWCRARPRTASALHREMPSSRSQPSTCRAGHDLGRNEQRSDQAHAQDNGKTWNDVSISGLSNASRAEHLGDRRVALRCGRGVRRDRSATRIGDYTPYFYRTHDYGKTWTTDRRTGLRRISRAAASRA